MTPSSTNPSAALSALLLDLANWREYLRMQREAERAKGGRS